MNKKEKMKEKIQEYMMSYGQRIGGHANIRRLYNQFKKQIRDAKKLTISLSELKGCNYLHNLINDLTMPELRAVINEAVTDLWITSKFEMVIDR